MSDKLVIEVTENGARVVQGHIKDIGEQSKESVKGVEQLKRALEFVGIGYTVEKLIEYADSGTKVRNVLHLATKDQTDFNAAIDAAYNSAIATGTSVNTLAELYDSLATAGKDYNLTQKQTSTIADTIVKAFGAEGKSADEAEGALRALSKSLVKGTADARGIIAVLNESNLLAESLAEQFGKTASEFIQAIAKGEISSKDLFKALEGASKPVNEAWNSTTRTVQQSIRSIQEAFVQVIDSFQQTTGFFTGVADLLSLIANHMYIASTAAAAFGVVWSISVLGNFQKTLQIGSQLGGVLGGLSGIMSVLTVTVNGLTAAFRANPIGFIITAVVALITVVIALYENWNLFRKSVDTVLVSLGLMTLETARAHDEAGKLAEAAVKAAKGTNQLSTESEHAAKAQRDLADSLQGTTKYLNSYGEVLDSARPKQLSFLESVKAATEALGGTFDMTNNYTSALGNAGTASGTTASSVNNLNQSISAAAVQFGTGTNAANNYAAALNNVADAASHISDVSFDGGAIHGGNFGGKGTYNVGSPEDIVQWIKEGKLTGNYLVDVSNANPVGFIGNAWLESYKAGLQLYYKEMQQKNQDVSARLAAAQQTPGSSHATVNTSDPSAPTSGVQSKPNIGTVYVNISTPDLASFGASQDQIRRQIAAALTTAWQNA